MKRLEKDPRLKETRRIPSLSRKEKPRVEKVHAPFDYEPILQHFRRSGYNLNWIEELKVLLALIEVPFRKKTRYWRRESVHTWTARCIKRAAEQGLVNQDEADSLLEWMERERAAAVARYEKRIDLPGWRRTRKNAEMAIDGQSMWDFN
jgi:hypothetical protein